MACIMSTYSICCVRKDFRSPILSHHQVTPNYAGFSVQIGVLCFSEPRFWATNPGIKLGNSSREKEAVDPWLTLKHITWSPLFRILTYLVHVVSTNFWYFSVQFSRSVMSDSLRLHELQHARPPCPTPTPGVHSDSHPSHPLSSSSPPALNPSQRQSLFQWYLYLKKISTI